MSHFVSRRVRLFWIGVLLCVSTLPFPLSNEVQAQGSEDRLVVAIGASGAHELYTINPDGSDRRRLVSKGDSVEPSWSPDRRKIVFSSTRESVTEIYVINADGTGETQITKNNGTANILPNWSPDGLYLVFISNRSGKNDIYYTAADGRGDVRQLTQDPKSDFDTPAWSPDGKTIAFASNNTDQNEIWTMDSGGGHLRQLTHHTEGDYNAPAWSPDGKTIAFAAIQNGDGTVLSINASGGTPNLIADMPGQFVGAITWARNGKSVAFMSWTSGSARSVQFVNLSGGGARTLTEDGKDIDMGWPSWSVPPKVNKLVLAGSATTGSSEEDEDPTFNPETDTPAKTRRLCNRSPLSRLDVGMRGRVTLIPPDPSDMRATPASRTIVATMPAGAIFKIVDGPDCTNNLTWWRVTWRGVTGWTPEGERSTYWLEPIPREN